MTTRRTRCPICNATHAVTAADRAPQQPGERVSARMAVETAHHREAVEERSAGPFRMFSREQATIQPAEDARADYDRARREHLAAFAAWEAAGMVDGTAEAREVMAASARLNVARRAMMAR